jgi:hypothetical protein
VGKVNEISERMETYESSKNINSGWRLFLPYLTPRLQLDLLRRLINYHHPVPRDWVNLFKQLRYEFQISWHYRVILIISFSISITAIVKISLVIGNKPNNIDNWLLSPLIYIIIIFWMFLWKGIEKRLEANTFITFGLFGLTTFQQAIWKLYNNGSVWGSISLLKNTAANFAWILIFVLTLLNGGWGLVFLAILLIAAARTKNPSGDKSKPRNVGEFLVLISSLAILIGLAWSSYGFIAVCFLLSVGTGLGVWERAKEKQDWLKYLAILAVPWFCTFPIVFIFSTLAMHDFLSWQWPQIVIAWIIIFGTCTVLWQRGQKLDHDARNPLYGILDKQYTNE